MSAFSSLGFVAASAIALLTAATGCGQADAQQAAPRTLELPAQVQPLAKAGCQPPARPRHTAVAGYEQAGGPRIVDLSAEPAASSPDLIREPATGRGVSLAPPVNQPAAPPPPRRNQFRPRELLAESPAPTPDSLPDLPPRPYQPEPQPMVAGPELNQNPPAELPPVAAAQPTLDRSAMQPVADRAAEISNHAYSLAHRGMLYAARAELIQSLQLVAQARDLQQGTTANSASLAAGLTALKEAQDFAPSSGSSGAVVNVAEIAKAHRIAILKDIDPGLSPVVAQQQYFAFAQDQLAAAVSGEPVASLALYRLGRLQDAMAAQDADRSALQGPQAMVFHQAALAADDQNYLAANELGVLMARYGQLHEARRLLVHSISIQPHQEGWHNLSVVHRRLGEEDLARRADHERQLLAQRSPAPASSPTDRVAWVDPQTFAANSPPELAQNAATASVRGSASFGVTR